MSNYLANMAGCRLRPLVAWAAALGVVVFASSDALGATARVTWLPPSSGAAVSGYSVYVRNAAATYGSTPLWTGNPAPAADGSISALVTYTPASSGTNYFSVVARATTNVETGLSRELYIGSPNLCRSDTCWTKTSCDFSSKPDGTSCDDTFFCNGPEICRGGVCDASASRNCADNVSCTDDTCDEESGTCTHVGPPGCCLACETNDPCLADSCSQGDCSAPLGTEIEVNRIRLMNKAAGVRLAAKGRFEADSAINPAATGAVIELRSVNGEVLFSSTIGPQQIKAGAQSGRYRFTVTRAQSEFVGNGVTRLDFRVKGTSWLTTLMIESPLLIDAFHEPTITWMIRLGTACMRRLDMPCSQGTARSVCR